jgi:hypothetical protein
MAARAGRFGPGRARRLSRGQNNSAAPPCSVTLETPFLPDPHNWIEPPATAKRPPIARLLCASGDRKNSAARKNRPACRTAPDTFFASHALHGGALREMSITNDFLYRSAVHLLHQQRVAGFRPQE